MKRDRPMFICLSARLDAPPLRIPSSNCSFFLESTLSIIRAKCSASKLTRSVRLFFLNRFHVWDLFL